MINVMRVTRFVFPQRVSVIGDEIRYSALGNVHPVTPKEATVPLQWIT